MKIIDKPLWAEEGEKMRIKFALLGARIGLEMEEPGAVKSWLESLDGLEIRAETAELVRVFDARAKLLEGDTVKLFEASRTSVHRFADEPYAALLEANRGYLEHYLD